MNRDEHAVRTLEVGDAHQVDIPLRWGDSDCLNHVNNTIYFRMMEEARVRILYEAGYELPGQFGVILAHASCDFLRPLTYPGDVRVTHTVVRIGRSSMDLDLTLEKVGEEGEPYARSRNVLVWVNYQTNRAEPWPPRLLERMAAQMRPAA
ncbi:thioesterase family protein [Bordetella bronchiseptica MBORD635]|uniref:acyl-CoA thioesterase n=1 Tax=Bordetella bronchiseptica TaxID=518 RepID=UPI000460DEB8|nr:thioesterase family protein [Bordetella bronchiseptica]KDC77097.1 thioesterase family protein [Bordetella bronchiseptica MBORD635]